MSDGLSGLVNRIIAWADGLQREHGLLGFPYAVVKKYGDDAGGRQAALITCWPASRNASPPPASSSTSQRGVPRRYPVVPRQPMMAQANAADPCRSNTRLGGWPALWSR